MWHHTLIILTLRRWRHKTLSFTIAGLYSEFKVTGLLSKILSLPQPPQKGREDRFPQNALLHSMTLSVTCSNRQEAHCALKSHGCGCGSGRVVKRSSGPFCILLYCHLCSVQTQNKGLNKNSIIHFEIHNLSNE